MKYTCKECHQESEAQSIEEITRAGKVCYKCRNNKTKAKSKLYYKNYKREPKQKICPICNNKFESLEAKYCSKECRSIGTKLSKIEINLSKIKSLKETMNTKVYNFSDYTQYDKDTR